MQDLLNTLVLLAILSCAMSTMLSSLTGKKGIDPWLILRPLVRLSGRMLGNVCRAAERMLQHIGNDLWRKADRRSTSLLISVLLYCTACLLYFSGKVIALPAVIVGSKK